MPSPEILLEVLGSIPVLGAEPGDLILIRPDSFRPVVLQRELPRSLDTLHQSVVNASARIVDVEGNDALTFASLKPDPSTRTPLRLIRGGAR